jgi:hypothetical protein
MKYPLGIQTFENIRTDGYLYVDKTALVYELVKGGKYYFLSRPRRFGKSLLIATLEAYFQGRRELFKGLAIELQEKDWTQYPVLHLDLNAEKYTTSEALTTILNRHLKQWEKVYRASDDEKSVADRFTGIIRRAYEQTGQRVVILVDEYDKPLLQAFGNKELQDDYRATLKAFYGVEKTMDGYIQFAFFTGVTKFSKVSVFSDLNNLTDITMDRRYAEICGFTEQEIHARLDAEVEKLAEEQGLTREACYAQLREYYDGYHFHPSAPGVYNPYSLLNALDRREFGGYWFETGTPSFLVEAMRHANFRLDDMSQQRVTANLLGSIDNFSNDPLPLLFQSGYLTISSYDPRFKKYTLRHPNREVAEGFTDYLVPYYAPAANRGSLYIENFIADVEGGQPEAFVGRLDMLFARGDYQIAGDAELYFQNVLYVIFTMMGFYTEVERHTTDGRMDMVIQTPDYVYIFEFKLDKSADEALQQIEDKQYAKPFEHDSRKLYKIGINFSTQTRRMDGWKIAE